MNNEILDYYVKQLTASGEIANLQIIDINNSAFRMLQNVVYHYIDNFDERRNLKENTLIFHNSTTLNSASILYQNDLIKDSNGAEFFETVKLK